MKHSLDVRGGRAVVVTVAAWIVVATGCGSAVSDGGLFAAADASADVQTHQDTGAVSSGTGSSSTGTGTGIVGTSSGTGTGTGLPSSSSSTGKPGTGTGTGKPGSSTGSGTGYDPTDPGAGDQGASCVPPASAPTCTPGLVACTAMTSCPAPAMCCLKNGGGECVSSAGDCHGSGGVLLACEEAGDCPTGQACCGSLSASGPTTSCETLTSGACPTPSMTIGVQVCRSDNECPSGKCSVYTCQSLNGSISIEACNNPTSMYCQPS